MKQHITYTQWDLFWDTLLDSFSPKELLASLAVSPTLHHKPLPKKHRPQAPDQSTHSAKDLTEQLRSLDALVTQEVGSLRRCLGLDSFVPEALICVCFEASPEGIQLCLPTRLTSEEGTTEEAVLALEVVHPAFADFEFKLTFQKNKLTELRICTIERAPGFFQAGLVEGMLREGFTYLFEHCPDVIITLEAARSDELIGYSYWPEKLGFVNVKPLQELYGPQTPAHIRAQVETLPAYFKDFTPEHFKLWRKIGVTFEARLTAF